MPTRTKCCAQRNFCVACSRAADFSLLLQQCERQLGRLWVQVVYSPQVAAVVLDPAERGATQLAGGVDPVDGLVLGQAALVSELLATGVAREDVLGGPNTTALWRKEHLDYRYRYWK